MKKHINLYQSKRYKIERRKWYYFTIALMIVLLLSIVSFGIVQIPVLENLQISPLIIGMLLGMIFFYPVHKQKRYIQGIYFCSNKLLRLGIILYGFRISMNELFNVGMSGFLSSLIVVLGIYAFAILIGKYLLHLDNESNILIGSGSAICGAAAVLAVEASLKLPAYKSGVAVGTVIIYGMLAMFLYPIVYELGIIPFNHYWEGVYIGATIHEVAQVVAASSAISPETEQTAVIVKMIRVMLLIPVLVLFPFIFKRKNNHSQQKNKITIPWFALLFLLAIIINSLLIYVCGDIGFLNKSIQLIDTFVLTIAMTALGLSIDVKKMLRSGGKAVLLAGILFFILLIGGFGLIYLVSHIAH
ncbi:MAG: YeiH family protein [Chitinophagaceae bacterium]